MSSQLVVVMAKAVAATTASLIMGSTQSLVIDSREEATTWSSVCSMESSSYSFALEGREGIASNLLVRSSMATISEMELRALTSSSFVVVGITSIKLASESF
uniref:Uncharacterized protein n=1 Tax=Setaria italica TaxID=4555 RepID=K3ZB36_SETIT